MTKEFVLPNDLIILISGVPGVGKTTISYELLKTYKEFRLVEETDVIREVLRGYNTHLMHTYKIAPKEIYSHNLFLNYNMASEQCRIMKNCIINIIERQRRKGIPSIINGVHIIPEELYIFLPHSNIIYLNLYVDSEDALWNRLKYRDQKKYKPECIPLLYQTNIDLKNSLERIPKNLYNAHSINVSQLTIQETICEINKFLSTLY